MMPFVAIALAVSVAFVVFGKIVMPNHHSDLKGWEHIRKHDRVYYMRAAHLKVPTRFL